MPSFRMFKDNKLVNVIVADSVEPTGSYWDRTEELAEEILEPAGPGPRYWTQDNIRSGLSLSEKVVWDNDSLPEVITAKLELAFPRTLEETTEILEFLVSSNVISPQSKDRVLQ